MGAELLQNGTVSLTHQNLVCRRAFVLTLKAPRNGGFFVAQALGIVFCSSELIFFYCVTNYELFSGSKPFIFCEITFRACFTAFKTAID